MRSRKAGYYWVRIKGPNGISDWFVGEYLAEGHWFDLFQSSIYRVGPMITLPKEL